MSKREVDLRDSTELDWDSEKESWNVYRLKDGATLKVKLVLRGVRRLNAFEPDGSPVYIINSTNVVRAIDIPKKWRKEVEKLPIT